MSEISAACTPVVMLTACVFASDWMIGCKIPKPAPSAPVPVVISAQVLALPICGCCDLRNVITPPPTLIPTEAHLMTDSTREDGVFEDAPVSTDAFSAGS